MHLRTSDKTGRHREVLLRSLEALVEHGPATEALCGEHLAAISLAARKSKFALATARSRLCGLRCAGAELRPRARGPRLRRRPKRRHKRTLPVEYT